MNSLKTGEIPEYTKFKMGYEERQEQIQDLTLKIQQSWQKLQDFSHNDLLYMENFQPYLKLVKEKEDLERCQFYWDHIFIS